MSKNESKPQQTKKGNSYVFSYFLAQRRRSIMIKPIGLLMIEHRLIERMIALIGNELEEYKKEKTVKPEFIDLTVDFFRTYADKLHHGKEEDILFRDLKMKNISGEHRKIMEELIEEHKWGRNVIGQLEEANEQYKKGSHDSVSTIWQCLTDLVNLYPQHIEKEDKHFFIPSMEYFDEEEKRAMIEEEQEFDKDFMHKIYRNKILELEKKALP